MLDSRVSDKMGLRCKGVSFKVLDKVRCKFTKQDDGEFTSVSLLVHVAWIMEWTMPLITGL